MGTVGMVSWIVIGSFSLMCGCAMTKVSDRLINGDFHNARFRWLYLDVGEVFCRIRDRVMSK